MNFWMQMTDEWGVVGWVILAFFAVATFMFFRRYLYLHKVNIDSESFLLGIINNLQKSGESKIIESIAICTETRGPVASVVRSLLGCGIKDAANLKRAADEAALIEIPKLQRNAFFVAAIGQMMPMLGLLGTVLALYGFFGDVAGSNSLVELGVSKVAKHVAEALVTTAMGVAGGVIISFYNVMLQERCRVIVGDMEKTALELINFLVETEDVAGRINTKVLAEANAVEREK